MITNDLILPSIYQLRREGAVRRINVCALNNPPLKALADNREMNAAFPGQTFTPFPDFEQKADDNFPDLYKEVLSGMEPRQTVVVAMPDQRHYPVVMEALKNNQHVLCVRPLVLEYKQTEAIKKLAHDKGFLSVWIITNGLTGVPSLPAAITGGANSASLSWGKRK